MALAFETAANSGLQTPGVAGRPPLFSGSSNSVLPSAHGAAGNSYPYASTPGANHSAIPGLINNAASVPSPASLSSAYRNAGLPATLGGTNAASTLESVTSTWLGTDDLLDQYMQSILPIFNDFDHATNSSMVNSIGGGGGVGVPISEVGR